MVSSRLMVLEPRTVQDFVSGPAGFNVAVEHSVEELFEIFAVVKGKNDFHRADNALLEDIEMVFLKHEVGSVSQFADLLLESHNFFFHEGLGGDELKR